MLRIVLTLAFLTVVSTTLCGGQAFALDRVTLRNGFTYDCGRREAIDPAHTRLFLSTDPDAGYVDVPTAEIVAVDPFPVPSAASHSDSATLASRLDVPSLLASAATAHNIDRELLASVVHAESGGRTHAISRTGARGLMQLMPATAQSVGVVDSFQPEENINGGTTYLDALLTRYGDDLALALAAYNAGPAAVARYHGVPPFRETQRYVARVMTEFKRRKQALERSAVSSAQATVAFAAPGKR